MKDIEIEFLKEFPNVDPEYNYIKECFNNPLTLSKFKEWYNDRLNKRLDKLRGKNPCDTLTVWTPGATAYIARTTGCGGSTWRWNTTGYAPTTGVKWYTVKGF